MQVKDKFVFIKSLNKSLEQAIADGDLSGDNKATDFSFDGSFKIEANSSFILGNKSVSVKANKNVYLNINGSLSIDDGGSIRVGSNSSMSVRGI